MVQSESVTRQVMIPSPESKDHGKVFLQWGDIQIVIKSHAEFYDLTSSVLKASAYLLGEKGKVDAKGSVSRKELPSDSLKEPRGGVVAGVKKDVKGS